MDEQKLISIIEQAQQGDRTAFGELVRQFESTIFATVMKRLRNHAEAIEVTQDVFVQAMRKIDQLKHPRCFVGWIRQIAVRMSINRAIRNPVHVSSENDLMSNMSVEVNTPLDDLMQNERADHLHGGLDRLKDLDRQTLIAFYFEGRSLKQMSDQFNSPVGTIKRRLHTARNRLREELGDLQTV